MLTETEPLIGDNWGQLFVSLNPRTDDLRTVDQMIAAAREDVLAVPGPENISFLRSQNGGVQSRMSFNLESLGQQKTNMMAALGRIVDVDIAEETTNLSKYSILQQAAASMLAQANQSSDVALMLLR